MGYTPPSSIDAGSPAIDRASGFASPRTLVDKANPANSSGKITSVEIWAISDLSNCEVATFYIVSGNNLSTRDTHTIGSVTAGSKQTFSGLDITVEAGDYIGIRYSAGSLEGASSGGVGIWDTTSDNIPCTNALFTYTASRIMSLYGIGTTGAGELTIGEAYSITDSLVKNVTKQLAEASSIVDSLTLRLFFTEALDTIDSIITAGNKAKSEAFNVIDGWAAKLNFTEILNIIDSLTNSASLAKSEAFGVVDSWLRRMRLAEAFQTVDSFARTISFYIAETLGIIDTYKTGTIWIEEIKNVIDWIEADDTGWFGGWFSKGWFSGNASWIEETKETINWTKE